ncbi:MAG: transglutaminase domain-containing protein [Lachnospiraceae bacterium]|nr:transglutaminase domain-containing protein [Lachnospiraceae bacterium]
MRHIKSLLASILVLALIFGSVPVPALADEGRKTENEAVSQANQFSEQADSNTDKTGQQTDSFFYQNPLYSPGAAPQSISSYSADTPSTVSEETPPSEGTFTSEAKAADVIRQKMKQRIGKFALTFVTPDEDYRDVMLGLFYLAMEETGVPDEGDYLLWQWEEVGGNISYYPTNGSYHYTFTYSIVYYTTLEQEQEVSKTVDTILSKQDLNNKTTYEKIESLYRYLVTTVDYDYDTLEDNEYKLKYTAYAALINKTAVCQGYALALYRLLRESDIPVRIIVGTGNGESHAWNIISIGKSWYNADSTWDSSSYEDSKEYSWFLLNETNFKDHVRDKEYQDSDFTKSYPMAAENYNPEIINLANEKIRLSKTSFDYDGTAKEPSVTIDGLTKDVDFSVAYQNNVNAGTASAIATAIAPCTGSITAKYTINPLIFADISIKGYRGYYDKKAHTVSVTAPEGASVYYSTSKDGSYTTNRPSFTEAGKHTVYCKIKKKNYKTEILKAYVEILLKTPEVRLYNTSSGITIKCNHIPGASKYVIYQRTSDGTKKLKSVTSDTSLRWTHEGRKNGSKYTYTIKAYHKTAKSSCISGKSIYRLTTPSITSLENSGSKKITVQWSKNSKATGYQIQYGTKSDFSNAKIITIKTNKTLSKTISSLSKGKVYYVRTRSYKTVSKNNYYSGWSAKRKKTVH